MSNTSANGDHPRDIDSFELLRNTPALESFSDEDIVTIAGAARLRRFTADEVIYSEGEAGDEFLFVGTGEVIASRETPVGIQQVATLGPGEICGEISVLDGKPRSSSVSGSIPGVLLCFGGSDVANLLANDGRIEIGFLKVFCRSLARKIRQANMVMTQIMAPEGGPQRADAGAAGEQGIIDDELKRSLLRDHGLGSSDLEELATYLEAKSYSGGDRIFVENELGDTLYIVADGQVRISRHLPGMGEEALAILNRGEVFGEMAWIDDSPRSADAIAHTGGCTVLGITGDQLDGSLGAKQRTHAQFLKLICQVLCSRIRNMNDQLVAYRTMAFF